MATPPRDPFDVASGLSSPGARRFYGLVRRPLEGFLGLPGVRDIYTRLLALPDRPENFFEAALLAMDCRFEVTEEDLEKVPRTGPLVVVANHPLGGADGIALGAFLAQVRPDARLLVNFLLTRMPEIAPWVFAVDPFGGKASARRNLAGMRAAHAWLAQGGCLGTFPAGEVSSLRLRPFGIADPVWNPHVLRLVRKAGATVLPVYFEGRNSLSFYLMGLLHPRLRTARLGAETVRRQGRAIRLRVGQPIAWKRLARFEDDAALLRFLRLKTYLLGERRETARRTKKTFLQMPPVLRRAKEPEPVAEPVDPAVLEGELAALPPECLLHEHGSIAVYCAGAAQIPHALREIGRLREVTFRAVQEGTGKALDLDRFDQDYDHLFLWDRAHCTIAGAYRIGPTDRLLARRGPEGLYTRTLFRFRKGFLEEIGDALELGRSFVAPAYQKKHFSLSLLWKGIGVYLVRHPRYRTLFGPVSISKEYQKLSKDLMVQFLRKKKLAPGLARLVRAKRPPRPARHGCVELSSGADLLHDLDDVSALISEIEPGGNRAVPILLKHYVKLNARLLAFNIDPDFGDALDGLMVVHLGEVEEKMLRGYMGEEGYARFCRWQETNALQEA